MPRVKEYNLRQQWKSPNGTIRSILDGTVFRKPIIIKHPARSPEMEKTYNHRHAYGDIYKNVEIVVDGPGTAEIVPTPEGAAKRQLSRFMTSRAEALSWACRTPKNP